MCCLYFLCAEFILLEETSSNNYFILKKHLQWNCYLFQETEMIICLCASNLLLFICKWKFCYCLFASVQSQIQVWVRFAILTSHEWILSRMNCFVRIWKIQLKPQNFSEKKSNLLTFIVSWMTCWRYESQAKQSRDILLLTPGLKIISWCWQKLVETPNHQKFRNHFVNLLHFLIWLVRSKFHSITLDIGPSVQCKSWINVVLKMQFPGF